MNKELLSTIPWPVIGWMAFVSAILLREVALLPAILLVAARACA